MSVLSNSKNFLSFSQIHLTPFDHPNAVNVYAEYLNYHTTSAIGDHEQWLRKFYNKMATFLRFSEVGEKI